MRTRLAVTALALALTACGARTEVVLGFATDLPPTALEVLRITLLDDGGQTLATELIDVGGAGFSLPASFGVGGVSGAHFTAIVDGGPRAATAPDGRESVNVLVSRRARFTFLDGRTLFDRMSLAGACEGELDGTCAAGSWCVHGVCRALDIDSTQLPDYHPGDENHASCGDDNARFGLSGGGACTSGSCVDGLCLSGSATPLGDGGASPADGGALDGGSPDLTAITTSDAAGDLGGSTDAALLEDASPDSAPPPADAPLADAPASVPDLVTLDDLASAPLPDLAVSAPSDLAASISGDLTPAPIAMPNLDWYSPSLAPDDLIAVSADTSATRGAIAWAISASGYAVSLDAQGGITVENIGASDVLSAVLVRGNDVYAAGKGPNGPLVYHRDAPGQWRALSIPSTINNISGSYNVVALYPDGASGGVLFIRHDDDPPFVLRFDANEIRLVDLLGPASIGDFSVAFAATGSGGTCGVVAQQGGSVDYLAEGKTIWTADTTTFAGIQAQALLGCTGGPQLVGGFDDTTQLGAVQRRDALGAWSDTGFPSSLGAVAGLVSSDGTLANAWALALPQGGMGAAGLARYDGTKWTALPAPTLSPLHAAAATTTSAGKPWLVVAASTGLLELTASGAWVTHGGGPTIGWTGRPWGSGKTLVVPSGNGLTITRDLTSWSPLPINVKQPAKPIAQVTAAPSGKLFAVSGDGLVLSGSTSALDTLSLDAGPSIAFTGVWAFDDTNVYASDTNTTTGLGEVRALHGSQWSIELAQPSNKTGDRGELDGIYGFSTSDIYAVGTLQPFAASSRAAIYHRDGTQWSPVTPDYTAPDTRGLRAVWGASAGDVWMVGYGAVVYHTVSGAAGVSAISTPAPIAGLLALGGSGPDDVFAVGTGGTVLSWNGVEWAQSAISTSVDLTGVYVDAANVWVGGANRVLRWQR